jgi:hypothetical protein
MAQTKKPVHMNIQGIVHVLGRAATWDDVILRIGDFAEEQYGEAFGNRRTRRTLTLDALLRAHHHNPQTWHLSDHNSREQDRSYYVAGCTTVTPGAPLRAPDSEEIASCRYGHYSKSVQP